MSKDLKPFIKNNEMFVEYDEEIHADDSILNIPMVASVLPLAWLSGSNIVVDSLDKGFKESMDKLQEVFKKMLPLPKYGIEILTDELIENQINPENPMRRTGILFSGGVDSYYSLVSNLESKPRLVMHWGVEGPPYPVYRDYWEMVNKKYTKYAEKNDLTFNLTRTNVREIIKPRRVGHYFHRELYYGSLWVRLQESLVLLCLAAPISINRFDRLLIAASMYEGSPSNLDVYKPHSARPEVDEVISWAGLRVKHDGFIPRYQKVKYLVDYLKKENITFRVCLARPGNQNTPDKMNCNNCSKCYRTIMQLAQAGYDPNNCGFKVDETTFTNIKEHYMKYGLDVYGENSKKIIPEIIEQDIHGSKAFFEWLKDYNPPEGINLWPYRDLYFFLPFHLAKILNEIYDIFELDIHEGNPVLPNKIVKRIKTH